MDKNKSIDGLSSRRSKTAAKVSAKKTSKTKVSLKTTKTTPKTKTSTPKPVAKKTTTKKVVEPVTTSTTEDFLKPVQAFDFDEQSGELKASTTPIKKGKKMKKIKKPVSKKRKIITRIVIIILSLLLIAGIIFIIWGNDIIAKITGGQGNVFDLVFQDENYEPLKADENGRTNILAFGTSGYDMEGTEGTGVHDGAQLTDSIMIIKSRYR